MGCLILDTAVENRSLAAFSLWVITGSSPLIALTGVSIHTPWFFCFSVQYGKSE